MPPLPPIAGDDADYDDSSDASIEAPRQPRSGPASRRTPEDEGPDPLDDPRAPRSLRRTPPAPRRSRPRDFDDYDEDDADQSDQRWRQPRDDRYDRYDRRPPAGPDDSYDGSYGSRNDDDPRRRGPARPYPDDRSRGGRNDGRSSGGRGQRQPYDEADVYSEWERPARGPYDRDDRRGPYDDSYSAPYPDPRHGPYNASRTGGGYSPRHPGWREAASQWLSAAVPVPMPGKKSKRVPVILLLVVALIVLAVPGAVFGPALLSRLTASSTPYHGPPGTYTPGPTPKAQVGFKKYVSARANYSMDYPQAWTATQQDPATQGQPDYIDVFAPATPTGASMLVEQPGDAASTPDATIISGEVAAAQQGGVTFTATSSFPVQVNIGGEFWQRQDYLVSGNGPTSHEAILAGHHEGHAYVIVLTSGADTFSQDATAIFTPALNSFRFNS